MLRQYGPSVPDDVLRQLTGLFADLRAMVHEGTLNYPYSTRELVNIVKHMQVIAVFSSTERTLIYDSTPELVNIVKHMQVQYMLFIRDAAISNDSL
jgi:hypothetical protein